MLAAFVGGIVCFFINAFNREFVLSIISLSTALLFINIYGNIAKILTPKVLGYLLSIVMMFVAIAVLGIYGVEQTAVGFQTLYDIHLDGIAIGLSLILLSSLTFVFSMNRRESPIVVPKIVKVNINPLPIKKKEVIVDSEDWEEASIDDLESGRYIEA